MKPTVTIKKGSRYKKLYVSDPKIRYIILMSPRATGKSFETSRAEVIHFLNDQYYRSFVLRAVLDNVRDSVFRDCTDRVEELGIEPSIVESIMTMRWRSNVLKGKGFRSSDGRNTAKNKGFASVNRLLIDEAEEVDEFDFDQADLSIRTKKAEIKIVICFNTTNKHHWLLRRFFDLVPASKQNIKKHLRHDLLKDIDQNTLDDWFIPLPKKRKDTAYITGTFLDNIKHLNNSTIAKLYEYKEINLEYYLQYVVGLVPSGKIGRVFKHYKLCTEKEYLEVETNEMFGLDFGYTNDPTACGGAKIKGKRLYLREYLYQKGLTNPMIAEHLGFIKDKIKADSSEPKSIQELNQAGLWVEAASKGKDSVMAGLQRIKQFEIYVVESSKNLIFEFENYSYKINKNKEPTNKPEDKHNHCFVGETNIVTSRGLKKIKDIKVGDMVLTRSGYKKVLKFHDNGIKRVVNYTINGKTISCTDDHHILINNEWVKIKDIKIGDKICRVNFFKAKSINYTKEKNITQEGQKNYIERFISSTKELYQKVTMSTIKITIDIITRLTTWSWLKPKNTYKNTLKDDIKKTPKVFIETLKKLLQQLKTGINPKKGLYGIKNTLLNIQHGYTLKTLKKNVSCVKKSILSVNLMRKKANTALMLVSLLTEGIKKRIIYLKSALFASKFLTLISLEWLKHAQDHVVTDLEVSDGGLRRVYDLTIEETHEYFAEGFLVHNCIDAIRYALEEYFEGWDFDDLTYF